MSNGKIRNPEPMFPIGTKCTIVPPKVEIVGVNYKRLSPESEEITVSYDAVVIDAAGGGSQLFTDIPESGLAEGHNLSLQSYVAVVPNGV